MIGEELNDDGYIVPGLGDAGAVRSARSRWRLEDDNQYVATTRMFIILSHMSFTFRKLISSAPETAGEGERWEDDVGNFFEVDELVEKIIPSRPCRTAS